MLAHDDLGERYEPLWLRDVAAHAAAHGLRYLADADPSELQDGRQPPGVDAQLDALAGGDRVVWEQYADLLAGRAFRQTLLCRAEAPADDAIDPDRLARLWFGARAGDRRRGADTASWTTGAAPLAQRLHPRRSRSSRACARQVGFGELRARRRSGRGSPPSCGGRSVPGRSSCPPRRRATRPWRASGPRRARWRAGRPPADPS